MRESQMQACRHTLLQRAQRQERHIAAKGVKTAEEQFEKGCAVCQECFQRSSHSCRDLPNA